MTRAAGREPLARSSISARAWRRRRTWWRSSGTARSFPCDSSDEAGARVPCRALRPLPPPSPVPRAVAISTRVRRPAVPRRLRGVVLKCAPEATRKPGGPAFAPWSLQRVREVSWVPSSHVARPFGKGVCALLGSSELCSSSSRRSASRPRARCVPARRSTIATRRTSSPAWSRTTGIPSPSSRARRRSSRSSPRGRPTRRASSPRRSESTASAPPRRPPSPARATSPARAAALAHPGKGSPPTS